MDAPPCSVPCRGRAPSRPVGKAPSSRQFSVGSERLPHRVGADLCVRPDTPFCGTRPRADTQVGPYKSSIYPQKPGGDRARPLPVDRGAKQRADVPKAWLPPTKFRAEIWGVGQVVGPYGKPDQPPKPAGAQRSVRARVGEGWAGIGAKAIPKGGPPPRPPRQRLAKRKARKE